MDSKIIRKAIKNRRQAKAQADSGVKVYACEEILGSMITVRAFAQFNQKYREDLEVLHGSLLLDFCKESYTKEQKDAFLLGLDAFMLFFESAEYDVENYIQENKNA